MESVRLIWTLIEGTNDMVQSVRPDGTFEYVNKSWLRALGYTDDEYPDLHLGDVIYAPNLNEYEEYVARVMNGETLSDIQITFVKKDGTQVHVEGNLYPRYEGNRAASTIGFYRDITERLRAETTIRDERARTQFFGDLMTHDLTNIHQEILSTFELLVQTPSLSSELHDLVREGLTEVERAATLITNVKKLSQLYAEKPEITQVDPADALQEAVRATIEAFPDKRLLLKANLSPGQCTVLGNQYLKDVFYSLLHNAMKFDERKKVEVDIEAAPIMHTPFLKIQIKDHGRGVPDEHKQDVFARVIDRRESILGLGLGLTLVKKILESYGGQISIEDRVEGDYTKGANFIVLLRCELPGEQQGGTV